MTTSTLPRPHDRLDRFWRLASGGRMTLALVLLVGATLAVAALFPQLPTGLDNVAAERWLGTAASSYRGMATTFRALGVFTILEGPWLRGLLALLAYNLALRLADQAHRVGEATRPAAVPPPFPPGLISRALSLAVAPQAAVEAVQAAMRPRYPLLVAEISADHAQIYGRRHRVGAVGGLLLAAGPLLLLAGLIVNSATGWRTTEIPITTNSSVTLSVAGGLQIQLDKIEGDGSQATSFITLGWPDGRQEGLRVRAMQPTRSGNLWIVQTASGPALEARAYSGVRPLLLQALTVGGQVSEEIHAPFRQTQTEQAFAIPARNLALRVVSYSALPEQGIQRPVFLVEAYRGDDPTPLLTQLVEDAASLTIEDVTIELRRDRHAVLTAAYLPGMALLALGVLLLAVGAVLVLGWGFTETWVFVALVEPPEMTLRTARPLAARAEVERVARAVAAQVSPEASAAPTPLTDAAPPAAPTAHVAPEQRE